MANTLGSVVIQDLTFTARRAGQAVQVTYLNGGVANAETCSVTPQNGATPAKLFVTIASGTSTAAMIKAAVEADGEANALLSVAISGTGSNTQKTVVSANLSGGRAAAKATLTVQGTMRLTAESTGTGGNSTSFKLQGDLPINITAITDGETLAITSNTNVCVGSIIRQGDLETEVTVINSATSIDVADTTDFVTGAATAVVAAGSEAVRVNTAAIIVQVEDGVSTYADVKTAIEGFAAAAALVDVSFFGPTPLVPVHVKAMSTASLLTGGLAAAAAAIVLQDLTYAADATGTAANGKTVTYTTGATAGAEVVTVSSGNINVQISNGISTATQIATALNAAVPFTGTYNITVSGTGSTAQKTVNAAPLASEARNSTKNMFINESTAALTGSYVTYQLGFHAQEISIYNDEASGAEYVSFSLDGTNEGGRLLPLQSVTLNNLNGVTAISLKGDADAYRVNITGK